LVKTKEDVAKFVAKNMRSYLEPLKDFMAEKKITYEDVFNITGQTAATTSMTLNGKQVTKKAMVNIFWAINYKGHNIDKILEG